MKPGTSRVLSNFGRNVSFAPAEIVQPAGDDDVFESLERFKGRHIRAIGRLHSWSDTVVGRDVVFDLHRLDQVRVRERADGGYEAEIGAGCAVDVVLDRLAEQGLTLPVFGIVGAQTMAGAVATGTHGSGMSSLSHYVSAIRAAVCDGRGNARQVIWRDGPVLRAARCGLGCFGVYLSITVPVWEETLMQEVPRSCVDLTDALSSMSDGSRSQFYLVPESWRWYGQVRRPVDGRPGQESWWSSRVTRAGKAALVDIGFNGAVRMAGFCRSRRPARSVLMAGLPILSALSTSYVDRARHVLQMRHDRFRHVEMELFVPERHVEPATLFLEWALRTTQGEPRPRPPGVPDIDIDAVACLHGTYRHDYPITFRLVHGDDTMLSMTAGSARWYAISLLTYQEDRRPFLRMCDVVARVMATAFGARPHWGKICPLGAEHLAALYPQMEAFKEQRRVVDPTDVFLNPFARNVLGIPRGDAANP